ncbi:uncharacterized protein EAF01_003159 [Botrytis porri]|uniref:uncharacterized protein n=1 Tax=Botrytis porri TaxID=87229 RepID=UPI0018FF905E|nr:uncharacterized protein EAF01_003159 [Botrytis porri]KAF7909441.1 hypothetical protein EAF01_003159 [Botrytis porri]
MPLLPFQDRSLENIVPYPRFRVEESQTKSKYLLAKPFAETELGYEEMEKKQREVMEVVSLVGACIWRVSEEDRKKFVTQRRQERARKVNGSIDGSTCASGRNALDWWYNDLGDNREDNTEVGGSEFFGGIFKWAIMMTLSIVIPSSIPSTFDSRMFLGI